MHATLQSTYRKVKQENITNEVLVTMTVNDLKSMGLTLGSAKLMKQEISALGASVLTTSPASSLTSSLTDVEVYDSPSQYGTHKVTSDMLMIGVSSEIRASLRVSGIWGDPGSMATVCHESIQMCVQVVKTDKRLLNTGETPADNPARHCWITPFLRKTLGLKGDVTTHRAHYSAFKKKFSPVTLMIAGSHLGTSSQLEPDNPLSDNCKVLGRILLEMGISRLMPEFIKQHDTDGSLLSLSTIPLMTLNARYGIPKDLASIFVEKCRMASQFVDPGHERWLKACLILRACARVVRPFVGAVMKKLHKRVLKDVKDTISKYKICVDSDWECASLGDNELKFNERPVEMQIISFVSNGVATTHVPHRLSSRRAEPVFVSFQDSKGFFQNEETVLGSTTLTMLPYSLLESLDTSPTETRLVLVHDAIQGSSPVIEPFQVCSECGDIFTAVYCRCLVGQAPNLVNQRDSEASEAHATIPANVSDATAAKGQWNFWTIEWDTLRGRYKSKDHKLKSGDIVSFNGKTLPNGILPTQPYCIVNTLASPKSFCVCPLVIPSKRFELSAVSISDVAQRELWIFRPFFPIGLFRDAAYRYHIKGSSCDLGKIWDGINISQLSSDFSEFAKFFCSKTKKELKNYFGEHEERSPELLYNMIVHCKAFHASCTCFKPAPCPPHSDFAFVFDLVAPECASKVQSILTNIVNQASNVTHHRNKICHGNFYSLEEDSFQHLRKCANDLLLLVQELAAILTSENALAEHDDIKVFSSLLDVACSHHDEIFTDDLTQNPPRMCIMNRRAELASEERLHFNEMIRSYQDLQDQAVAMKMRKFERLPVCMMQDIGPQIEMKLGKRGGQGTVYHIEYWGQKLVAKVFHGADTEWRRELNSLTMLLHKNIVQVKYVIYSGPKEKLQNEPPVGYVMERMHCSLHEYSKEITIPFSQVMNLLRQVALALAYTHANGIAHMDIKPENILLDDSKSVAKLCDFGCAHFMQSTLHSEMTPRGTVFFMAPEMNISNMKSCDPFPVDVYAFGVTLWLLISPDTDFERLCSMWQCDWGQLTNVPADFFAVCELGQTCTKKNPEERPTMQQVYDKLDQMLE